MAQAYIFIYYTPAPTTSPSNTLNGATAIGLGTVTLGAFHEDQVLGVLGVVDKEQPLYVMQVGEETIPKPTST